MATTNDSPESWSETLRFTLRDRWLTYMGPENIGGPWAAGNKGTSLTTSDLGPFGLTHAC